MTGTYDLGANPHVMAAVGGTSEYGLVFAQRNKAVTYDGVEYGPSVVKGYLNASGQLNDGGGNLWLDLIPNLAATPADSYYVVTINIQGRVHAEIWIVPDVASVAVEAVRQAQPPGGTGSPFDLANATGLLGLAHGGTNQSSWTAARCVRVNNAGTQLESAAGDCGTGGGSAPIASATVSGTVKTDTTAADPVVYLKTSADTLLAGKASSVHTHSQNDVTNLTTDLAGKESLANKNQANGYAGLGATSKVAASQVQEVLAAADLTDYAGTSGSGTTAIKATVTTPSDGQCLTWNNSTTNWVNGACSGGSSNHNLLSATHPDTTAASVARGDLMVGIGVSPTWQRYAKGTQYQILTGGVNEPTWGAVALAQATAVSGILGSANGGTGNSFAKFTGPTTAEKTFALPDANATIEVQGNKNAASGYAGLDSGSRIAKAQAPSTTVYTDPAVSQTIQPTADASFIVKQYNGTNSADIFQVLDKDANKKFAVDASGNLISGALTNPGVLTLGATTSTTPSHLDLFGGDAATNAEAPYLKFTPSPAASGSPTYLYPSSTAGRLALGTAAPSSDPAATALLVTASSTDTLTNKTITAPIFTAYTVATLPAPATYKELWVSDGTSATDCTVGGGSTKVKCYYNGAAWTVMSGGGSGGGANTALSNLASVAINDHLLFGADNTKDIGATGATRPRTGYFGTSVAVQGSGAGAVKIYETDHTNFVAWAAPGTISSDVTWTLPNADSSGCFQSNGSGTVTIASCGGGSPAFSGITSGTNVAATMTVGSGATLNGAAGGIVDLTSLTPASGFKVPAVAGATPSATGVMAYDLTANTYKGYNGTAAKTFAYTDSNISGTAAGLSATLGMSTGGTNATSWTASRCVQVNSGGTALESAAAACGAGGGATTALDNLASVAINDHLLFGADNTKNIGQTGANRAANLYLGTALYVQGTGAGAVKIYDTDHSNFIAFAAPGTIASDVTWTFPNADSSGCFQSNGSGTVTIATCGGGGVTSLDTLTGAVTTAIGTTGTAPNYTHATTIDTLNIPMASTGSVTAGLLSKTDYDVFNGKPNLVTSGTVGVGPSKVGTSTTAARSDHDHKSVAQLAWFFPGTPATGVQTLTLIFPETAVNFAINDFRVTVGTTSASSSTFNIQRCTANCTTTGTFSDIYSTVVTLSANARTVAKGSAPNQNVASLTNGDQFRASLVTIGASLADVTVTMTYEMDTTN